MMALSCDQDKQEDAVDLRQLEEEAEPLIHSLARVHVHLRQLQITVQEYVLLKVIILTSHPAEDLPVTSPNDSSLRVSIEHLHSQHLDALRSLCSNSNVDRFDRLLSCVRIVEEAADILIASKMFYVPFLLTAKMP